MSLRGKLYQLGILAEPGAPIKFLNGFSAGSSGDSGSLEVYPSTASSGKLTIDIEDQTGDTTVNLNFDSMGQATTVNVGDPGASSSYLGMSTSQLTLAEMDVLDGAVAGTQAASKVVIPDANVNTGVSKVTELHIGATGSEVQVSATPAEINRTCDVSTRKVSLTGTTAITEALHEGKVGVITGSGAEYTYTLPEATGSGAIYRFIINEVNTSNTVFTTADAANCSFFGSVNILDLDAAAQAAYAPAATDEIMTLNGSTTGGAIGDYIQFIDMATDKWCVFGQLQCPTGSNPATPFSGA